MYNWRYKNYGMLDNFFYVLKLLIKWNKKLLICEVLNILCVITTSILFVYIPKWVVEFIENNAQQTFIKIVVAFMIWGILLIVANFTEKEIRWRLEKSRKKIVVLRVKKTMNWNYDYYQNSEILNLKDRVERATNSSNEGIIGFLSNVRLLLINAAVLMISIYNLIKICGFNVVCIFILSVICIKILNITEKRDTEEYWKKVAPINRKLTYLSFVSKDYIYAKDIRLYSIQKLLEKKQDNISKKSHNVKVNHFNRWIKCNSLLQICIMIQQIFIYSGLFIGIIVNNITISQFTFFWGIIKTFFSSNQTFFFIFTIVKSQLMQINDIHNFLEIDEQNTNKYVMSKEETIKLFNSFKKYDFELENVSFAYTKNSKKIFDNLSMKIKSGCKLAIVGINGMGKSTLVKLIMRLYIPDKGKIKLNGYDIQKFDRNTYYTLFAPMFQNIECFAMDVKNNVAMNNEIDRKKVKSTLKMVNLLNKLNKYKGIDTQLLKKINKEGIELSGGENQKLSFARVAYKDSAKILVLDEPTAAMDIMSELNLYKKFNEIVNGRTSLFITHRLLSVKFCDEIIVIHDGKIIERGTHENLMLAKGKYFQLFDSQAKYYRKKGD